MYVLYCTVTAYSSHGCVDAPSVIAVSSYGNPLICITTPTDSLFKQRLLTVPRHTRNCPLAVACCMAEPSGPPTTTNLALATVSRTSYIRTQCCTCTLCHDCSCAVYYLALHSHRLAPILPTSPPLPPASQNLRPNAGLVGLGSFVQPLPLGSHT